MRKLFRQLLYLSFDVSADLPVVSGGFSQEAEHWSQAFLVVGALLRVSQRRRRYFTGWNSGQVLLGSKLTAYLRPSILIHSCLLHKCLEIFTLVGSMRHESFVYNNGIRVYTLALPFSFSFFCLRKYSVISKCMKKSALCKCSRGLTLPCPVSSPWSRVTSGPHPYFSPHMSLVLPGRVHLLARPGRTQAGYSADSQHGCRHNGGMTRMYITY